MAPALRKATAMRHSQWILGEHKLVPTEEPKTKSSTNDRASVMPYGLTQGLV